MRRFSCACGRPVYFDNHECSNCGRRLGFDPAALDMIATADGEPSPVYCSNRDSVIRCNWTSDRDGPCLSCRLSRLIPALSKPENLERWRKLETAKRRLIYDLISIGMPVDEEALCFVFKEDRRTNPDVYDEHVGIGHAKGVITVNAAEADEVYREEMRQAMNEPVRTLLGHFRHESGHCYFEVVVQESAGNRDGFRRLFGDEGADYDRSLADYYANGPATDWPGRFISAYASAHPAEDWAETWAHYLNIRSVLEVALSTGLLADFDLDNWRHDFVELVIAVNEVMRSLGQPDAYPFIITDAIAAKIDFVHRAVTGYAG